MKTLLIFAMGLLALILINSVIAGKDGEIQAMDTTTASAGLQKAMFAGGCFWCMEKPFEKLAGVHSVTSGYAGGKTENPTYNDYMADGHIEVVEILYDPRKVSYEELLEVYWRQIDPTDSGGQFADRGHGYTTAVFYFSDEQRRLAEASKKNQDASGIFDKPVVTPIIPAVPFYAAEEYHQDYYKKNPLRYRFYRSGSGRDSFLEKVWKNEKKDEKMTKAELQKKLTPIQYKVTQEEGTEPAYDNEYWDNKRAGIYVDIVSNEPLFSSLDKYDSKSGWPSFTRPLVAENIIERSDNRLFMKRTEVRSRQGDSHLGHVFDDGPTATGLRYCINSAALRFIPAEDLEKEGFSEFLSHFENSHK